MGDVADRLVCSSRCSTDLSDDSIPKLCCFGLSESRRYETPLDPMVDAV